MKPRPLQFTLRRKSFHGAIAILFLGLLTPVSFARPRRSKPQSQVMTTTTRRQTRNRLPSYLMINWIRWLRRLRYIPTRSWLKRSLLPLIHLKLSNFSSGWIGARI